MAPGTLACCSASVVGNRLSRLVETGHELNQSSTSTGACEVTVSVEFSGVQPAKNMLSGRCLANLGDLPVARPYKVAHHVAFGFDCVVQEDHRVSRII